MSGVAPPLSKDTLLPQTSVSPVTTTTTKASNSSLRQSNQASSNLLHLLFDSSSSSKRRERAVDDDDTSDALRGIETVVADLARQGFVEAELPVRGQGQAEASRNNVLVGEDLRRITRKTLLFADDPRLSRALVLLTVCHDLVLANRTATQRELYYRFRTRRRKSDADFNSRKNVQKSTMPVSQVNQSDSSCEKGEDEDEDDDDELELLSSEITSRLPSATNDAVESERILDIADRFSSAAQLLDAIEVCTAITHCTRSELHIVAASKGSFSGSIEWSERDVDVDGKREWSLWKRCEPRARFEVPQCHDSSNLRVRHPTVFPYLPARFILLVEKNTIFHRLVQENVGHVAPCVVVTGRGFPDLATKSFVRTIASQLGLPVLGICDWNPHGMLLLLSYRDSFASPTTTQLPVESLDFRFAGVLARHVRELNVPLERFDDFTARDDACVRSLSTNPHVLSSPDLRAELETMRISRKKLDLDVLLQGDYLINSFLSRVIEDSLRGFVGAG